MKDVSINATGMRPAIAAAGVRQKRNASASRISAACFARNAPALHLVPIVFLNRVLGTYLVMVMDVAWATARAFAMKAGLVLHATRAHRDYSEASAELHAPMKLIAVVTADADTTVNVFVMLPLEAVPAAHALKVSDFQAAKYSVLLRRRAMVPDVAIPKGLVFAFLRSIAARCVAR